MAGKLYFDMDTMDTCNSALLLFLLGNLEEIFPWSMHLLADPHEMPELLFYRRVDGSGILWTSYVQDRFELF